MKKYRNGKQARIICTDRPGTCFCMLSLDEDGTMYHHRKDGTCTSEAWDLIEVESPTHEDKLEHMARLMRHPAVIELGELSAEIETYEKQHFPVTLPTLGEAMKFRREQTGESAEQIATRAGFSALQWQKIEEDGDYRLFYASDIRALYAIGIPAEILLA